MTILYVEESKTSIREDGLIVNPDKEWTPMTTQRIADVIKEAGYTPDSALLMNPHNEIAEGWSTDDVKSTYEDDYPEMSDEVARYILHTVDRNHDANIGISWDVIRETGWNMLHDIQRHGGRTLDGKFIPENEVHKYSMKDMMRMELVMPEEDAMSILEDLCKDHGDTPKHITPGDYEAAAKQWLEENKHE